MGQVTAKSFSRTSQVRSATRKYDCDTWQKTAGAGATAAADPGRSPSLLSKNHSLMSGAKLVSMERFTLDLRLLSLLHRAAMTFPLQMMCPPCPRSWGSDMNVASWWNICSPSIGLNRSNI